MERWKPRSEGGSKEGGKKGGEEKIKLARNLSVEYTPYRRFEAKGQEGGRRMEGERLVVTMR